MARNLKSDLSVRLPHRRTGMTSTQAEQALVNADRGVAIINGVETTGHFTKPHYVGSTGDPSIRPGGPLPKPAAPNLATGPDFGSRLPRPASPTGRPGLPRRPGFHGPSEDGGMGRFGDLGGSTPSVGIRPDPGGGLPGVSGRLDALLDSDSPFLERARARARQLANRRGLMSSSIAAGAGEAAAIDAALPIAQADAQIAAQERGRDLQEVMQRRDHMTQLLMQERGLDHSTAQQAANRQFQSQLQMAAQRFQAAEAALNRDLEIGRHRATLDQSGRIGVSTAVQNAMSAFNQRMNAISNNPNIPADVRADMIAAEERRRDDALSLIEQTFNVDLDWTTAAPRAA